MVFAGWQDRRSFAAGIFIILSAILRAFLPLQRITAIAPRPGGVEMAHIVSSFEYMQCNFLT
jgi:hypothetical protein